MYSVKQSVPLQNTTLSGELLQVETLVLRVWLILAVVFAQGCAGQVQYTGSEYRDREVAFRIGETPAGYRKVESADAKLAFQNDQLASTLIINARCEQDGDDVPLRALVQHLFIQFTDRQLVSEKDFALDGRAAYEMVLQARLDGVERHFIAIVIKKNGCVFDFVQVDPGQKDEAGELKEARDAFRQMVYGFALLEQKS